MGPIPRALSKISKMTVGIYERWPSWKSVAKRYAKYRTLYEPIVTARLDQYAGTGEIESAVASEPRWTLMDSDFTMYSIVRLQEGEELLVGGDAAGADRLVWALEAKYLQLLIDGFIHERFPTKFPGRKLSNLSFSSVMFLALAYSMRSVRTAALETILFEAYRRRWYIGQHQYPIFHFIVKLAAKVRGRTDLDFVNLDTDASAMKALLERWDSTPDELAPLVTAACDYHTQRTRHDAGKKFYEFNDGQWTHFPVEILMLYRIRESLGLANPEVDHPLMNGPLARLPASVSTTEDALLVSARRRLEGEGFDEGAILASLKAAR